MILRLEIKNLALLEHAVVDFESGMTVFTGETGAGKSLLMSALELLSGVRASREMIRSKAECAVVEAVFSELRYILPEEVQQSLLEDGLAVAEEDGSFPDELVLAREIHQSAKSFCRINGRNVPLQKLAWLGSYLLDINSQLEQASLFDIKRHKGFLDDFAGEELQELKAEYLHLFEERADLLRKQKSQGGRPEQRKLELDLLNFQINEIKSVNPKEGEEEKLREFLLKQQRTEREALLLNACIGGAEESDESALPLQLLQSWQDSLLKLAAIDNAYADLAARATVLKEELADIENELRASYESLDYRPEMVEKVEARLKRIADLNRKYAYEQKTVGQFLLDAEEARDRILSLEEELQQVDSKLQANKKLFEAAAERISDCRRAKARDLEKQIEQELQSLGMKHTRFQVAINSEARYGRSGRDNVEFLISTNPGEGFKALVKIASGGEASRIMLAIKCILTSGHHNATLVFDEPDSGVSGETCNLIARKLYKLSTDNQLFCVTHAPAIAAIAAEHIYISKYVQDETSFTELRKLDEAGRVAELSRLLAGDSSSEAVGQLAHELLEHAKTLR